MKKKLFVIIALLLACACCAAWYFMKDRDDARQLLPEDATSVLVFEPLELLDGLGLGASDLDIVPTDVKNLIESVDLTKPIYVFDTRTSGRGVCLCLRDADKFMDSGAALGFTSERNGESKWMTGSNSICLTDGRKALFMITPQPDSDAIRPAMQKLMTQGKREAPLLRDLGDKAVHHVDKALAFSRRDPLHARALLLHAQIIEQREQQRHAAPGVVIARAVVAVAGMAAAEDDAVGPALERAQDEQRIDTARARHADDLHFGGIGKPVRPRQVGARVRAPVAAEGDDLRLPALFVFLSYRHSASTSAMISLLEKPFRSIAPDGHVTVHAPQPWHTASLTCATRLILTVRSGILNSLSTYVIAP